MRAPFKGSIIFLSPSAFVFLVCRSVQRSVPRCRCCLVRAGRLRRTHSPPPVSPCPATRKEQCSAALPARGRMHKQLSPCVVRSSAYSPRAFHPVQRAYRTDRCAACRRRWLRTQGASDPDTTPPGVLIYTRTIKQMFFLAKRRK